MNLILIILGVFLGATASVGINIGNNIQALGLKRKDAGQKDHLFHIGTAIFVTASIINFAAFAFAPAAILAPLESFQFVANLFFNHYVNKAVITRQMIKGVSLVVLGCGMAVGMGPNKVYEFTLPMLVDFWTEPAWCGYLVGIMILAAVAQVLNMLYSDLVQRGQSPPYQKKVLPVTFAMSSALVGTQSVVQAKCLSECLEQLTAHEVNIFAYWYFWIALFLFVSLVAIWLFRLTKALEHFDPLFIIPMLQSNYILFATISGGIYFQEFNDMKAWQWGGFVVGINVMFTGLYLLAPEEGDDPSDEDEAPPGTRVEGSRAGEVRLGDMRIGGEASLSRAADVRRVDDGWRRSRSSPGTTFASPRAKTVPTTGDFELPASIVMGGIGAGVVSGMDPDPQRPTFEPSRSASLRPHECI